MNVRPFLVIALVLLVTAAGSALLLHSNESLRRPQPADTTASKNQPSEDEDVVTLEEFADYQCPSCRDLHPTVKELKKEYGQHLNLVFRNLPLTSFHKNAMAAAQAAEAARMQNRFWEMHDLLYERQDQWKDEANPRTVFARFAQELGLDVAQFTRDLDNEQVRLRIEADVDAAAQKGIDSTPTVLIDGRQLRGEMTTPDGVRKGVEVMMRPKGPKSATPDHSP